MVKKMYHVHPTGCDEDDWYADIPATDDEDAIKQAFEVLEDSGSCGAVVIYDGEEIAEIYL